mmetsp:Transcript_14256/g.45655  ORF Transcript_14256/g.45655 Transcript_14256/m.45655 type:complete len:317 (-) Transcript_14256:123-1073(-)
MVHLRPPWRGGPRSGSVASCVRSGRAGSESRGPRGRSDQRGATTATGLNWAHGRSGGHARLRVQPRSRGPGGRVGHVHLPLRRAASRGACAGRGLGRVAEPSLPSAAARRWGRERRGCRLQRALGRDRLCARGCVGQRGHGSQAGGRVGGGGCCGPAGPALGRGRLRRRRARRQGQGVALDDHHRITRLSSGGGFHPWPRARATPGRHAADAGVGGAARLPDAVRRARRRIGIRRPHPRPRLQVRRWCVCRRRQQHRPRAARPHATMAATGGRRFLLRSTRPRLSRGALLWLLHPRRHPGRSEHPSAGRRRARCGR